MASPCCRPAARSQEATSLSLLISWACSSSTRRLSRRDRPGRRWPRETGKQQLWHRRTVLGPQSRWRVDGGDFWTLTIYRSNLSAFSFVSWFARHWSIWMKTVSHCATVEFPLKRPFSLCSLCRDCYIVVLISCHDVMNKDTMSTETSLLSDLRVVLGEFYYHIVLYWCSCVAAWKQCSSVYSPLCKWKTKLSIQMQNYSSLLVYVIITSTWWMLVAYTGASSGLFLFILWQWI